jgi:hypothetical protein
MKSLTLIVVLLAAAVAVAADAPVKPYQLKAQQALAKYDKAVAGAEAAYKAALAKAKADVAADLAVALKLATQAGDFDACKIIQAKADELAKDDAAATPCPLDNTTWTWTDGKVSTQVRFLAGGGVQSGWGAGYWKMTGPKTAEAVFGTSVIVNIMALSEDGRALTVKNNHVGQCFATLLH